MSERKRLTDDDAARKWDALDRYVESADERETQRLVRADHLQAREDVKRLADELRPFIRHSSVTPTQAARIELLLHEVGQ